MRNTRTSQNETNKQILDTYDYYFGDNTQEAESAYSVYYAGDTPPNQNPNWYADEQAAKQAAHEAERDAISAIDDEIKQHNRDREDEDIDSKIAEVDKQLQYDRLDEYSRMQLEQKNRTRNRA